MTGTGMGFGEKNPDCRRKNPGGGKMDQGYFPGRLPAVSP